MGWMLSGPDMRGTGGSAPLQENPLFLSHGPLFASCRCPDVHVLVGTPQDLARVVGLPSARSCLRQVAAVPRVTACAGCV